MTFKHVKFQDSAVMRSLEKVAREKGLIKEEDFVKTASVKQASLVPTTNLLSNLLTLSEGLREAGFDKYAEELERNALAFKRAQTLYETSKEKGDDLIDAAHPDGGHKLDDVDSDQAVFHTILEKHLKNIEMVDKKPTGKLASSLDVLKAVKIALADAPTRLSGASSNQLKHQVDELDEKINSWALLPGSGTTDDTEMKTESLLSYVRSTLLNGKVTTESMDTTIKLIGAVISSIGSTFWTKETDVAKMLNSMKDYVNNFIRPEHASMLSNEVPETKSPFIAQIDSYLSTLRNWAVAVNNDPDNSPSDKKQAGDWIDARVNELNDLKSKFKPEEAEGLMVALNKSRFARESAQFKKTWIG